MGGTDEHLSTGKIEAGNDVMCGIAGFIAPESDFSAVEMDQMIKAKGYQSKVQVVANIHDEHQYEADADIAEEVAEMSIEAIKQAGRHFDLRVPLDGDANIGNNWKETH